MLVDLVQIIGAESEKPIGFRRVSVSSEAIKLIGEEGSGARIQFIDATDIRVTASRVEVKKMIEGKCEKPSATS